METTAVQVPQPQPQVQPPKAQQPKAPQRKESQPKEPQQKELQQRDPQAQRTKPNGEALTLRDILAANAVEQGAPQQGAGVATESSFLALMLQQMLGMEGAPQEGVLPGEGFAVLKEQLEKDGAEIGAQMLMEMLMASGQNVAMVDASEVVAQLAGEAVLETGVGLPAVNTMALMTSTAGSQQPATTTQQTTEQPVVAQTAVVQELAGAWKSAEQSGQESALSGQAAFQQAILEAQKLLKAEKSTEPETTPVDVDQLQTKVDANKLSAAANQIPVQSFAGSESVKEMGAPALPEADALLAQVKTGIATGLNSGRNEFVVKLKPEGLGEITVKLVEIGGQISMSIVTSNTQVQKMISGELAGLREAMKPYGVEVAQVTSQQESHFNAQQQSNFAGHQHQQFKENHTTNTFWRGDSEIAEDSLDDLAGEQPNSTLNTYI